MFKQGEISLYPRLSSAYHFKYHYRHSWLCIPFFSAPWGAIFLGSSTSFSSFTCLTCLFLGTSEHTSKQMVFIIMVTLGDLTWQFIKHNRIMSNKKHVYRSQNPKNVEQNLFTPSRPWNNTAKATFGIFNSWLFACYLPVLVTLRCAFFRTGSGSFLSAFTSLTGFLGSSSEGT